jgi:hypothetical protein
VTTSSSSPSARAAISPGRKDTSDGAVKLLARVYLKMDALTRRDRWMLSFYPLGAAPLPFQNEDGHYSIWKPSLRRVEPLLGKGEQRFPRDSGGDAIQLALDNLADDIPKPELAAIGKVVGRLRPSFEHSSRGYGGGSGLPAISATVRFLATIRSDKHMVSMDWIGPENAA